MPQDAQLNRGPTASARPTVAGTGTLAPPQRLTRSQWLVLTAALLGWMFDGVEMGLFSGVARPALQNLLGAHVTEADVGLWIGVLTAWFLVGAACGGLVFGWLGDRIGRVRAMAVSILTYSVFTGACYWAATPWQLAGLRLVASLGMGGEWSLGVALVVECWPNRLRPLLAGVIGAAGNAGYLLIALVITAFSVTPDNWRWIMLVCSAPAALALIVVSLLPESPRWRESVKESAAKPLRELVQSQLVGRTLFAIAIASIPLIGTWGAVQGFLPSWVDVLVNKSNPAAKGQALMAISIGAIMGSFVGPIIGQRLGRRSAYTLLCLASLIVCQALFRLFHEFGAPLLAMAALAGFCTASFYGWLPLYLPELFPTRVRATAQGLSYNFGRIFAAIATLNTSRLIGAFDGSYPRACATMTFVYLLGMAVIWLGPETRGQPLPE